MVRDAESANAALDLLPCGVAIAEASGRLVLTNRAARILLGLEGRSLDDVSVGCEGRRVSLGELVRDHAAGATLRQRLQVEHPEHGWLRTTVTRMTNGRPAPMVHLVVEPGPRRDWRWAGRSDPVASVAHEIRNVLTSLGEAVTLLTEEAAGPLSEFQKRLLTGANEDTARLRQLADDLLAASRSGAGVVRIAARRVDLAKMTQRTASSLASVAAKAEVELRAEQPSAGVWCHGDAKLLTQALVNLVGNALKFTPPGGRVDVAASHHRDGRGAELVEVAVKDTGPGLSAGEIDQILHQGRVSAREEQMAGLGLGLKIARDIVEQHGGRLAVESVAGEGSCFRLVLPRDFRQSEYWRLAQIAHAVKLAQAMHVPLSIVEIGMLPMSAGAGGSERHAMDLPLVEQCLIESLRPSDSVLAGGNSMTLLLYDADRQGARIVAERSVEVLARMLDGLPGSHPRCAIAFGLASCPADGTAANELAERARRELSN